jgi:ABC-type branched-subunit amino acid transport system ATPase component
MYRSTLRKCFDLLERPDQKKLGLMAFVQLLLSVLDLAGVALVGILATLAINGMESKSSPGKVAMVLRMMHINEFSLQKQATILGISAVLLLIGRTFLSVIFVRRTLFFLSRRGASISSSLFSKVISQSLQGIQKHSIQEYLYSITGGVEIITLRILAQFVTLISDGSLLIVMAIGLMVVDPVLALSTFAALGLVSYFLYRMMHARARNLGLLNSRTDIRSRESITEALNTFREISVKNRQSYYANEVSDARMQIANILAENNFMPYMSKYVIESTVVIAALVISATQFLISDAVHAVGTLSVFLAAGTRIAPAILRLQQGAIQIQSGLGNAMSTLQMIEELDNVATPPKDISAFSFLHKEFIPEVSISNLFLTYNGQSHPALSNINLAIKPGSVTAVVGPSGAGKTSLIDVILGVTTPDSGNISISRVDTKKAIQKWPGAVAYVPQDISIANRTIGENVTLGYDPSSIGEDSIWTALNTAQLGTFVRGLPNGLDTEVGDRGAKLSGGQRQRLGIARALITRPQLLVLDEATSALDGQSELDVSDAIQGLKGSVTVVMIAHRLSTVRNADQVIYMDQGRIVAQGSFDEVRSAVPDFDSQAKLMGL